VEFEWYNEVFVNFRDSKKPEISRLLPVPHYEALLQGLKGLEKEFDYRKNCFNFNGSGINLVMENGGITVSYAMWSDVSFWFNYAEWDKFVQAVKDDEYELDKLQKDFLKNQGASEAR
jgi:hypothetical protein